MLSDHNEDDSNKLNQPSVPSFSVISKSKLDKAQARRLKMPKRNRSAYFLFSMDIRAKLKTEFKDQLTPLEMQAKVSQHWRELGAREKEIYEAKAKEEKLEYLVAMDKFYSNLTPETLARSKTNRPKKPCSAYAHFVRDIKIDLKRENPKLIMQEILHIASEKWKNLPEESRVVYEEKARHDKEQYMAATRRGQSVAQDSSIKRNRINQESEKPVKNFFESAGMQGTQYKQVKLETHSVKFEVPSNIGEFAKALKIEEKQENSNTTTSPFLIKSDLETEQDIMNKFLLQQGLMLEPLILRENPNYRTAPKLQIPELNAQFFQQGFPLDQNLHPDEKVRNAMSQLALIRMMQANKNVEEAIMRKIEEVKSLQAQRLVFVHNMFWPPNPGSY